MSDNNYGIIYRLVITEHDNGQLLHYNKTKLATLTLTDGSIVKIEGYYYDNVHTLTKEIIDPYRDTLKEVVIHKGVKAIGDSNNYNGVFDNCTNLTNIFISSSVERIANNAFYRCTNLKTVTFEDPTKLRYLGEPNDDFTFGWCESLETINLTSDTPITYMPYRGFSHCTSLKSIVIPDTVIDIRDMALDGCSSLTEISIPAGVKTIDMQAFYNCTALTSITSLATTPPECTGTDVFVNIPSTCKVYVPAESISAYKAASQWSAFGNRIQAIPTT